MCLSRGGCEVGEGVAQKESGTRGMGVAPGRASRRAAGEVGFFLFCFVFVLKSSFGIESGSGEDGREAVTSEPQREVAGDSLCCSPPRGRAWFLLGV